MIIHSGLTTTPPGYQQLSSLFSLVEVDAADVAILQNLMERAEVFLIGPGIAAPVKEVQKIYAADKHLSVLVLAEPSALKQVKQAFQFAPFIGKNTLVVPLNPELNLPTLCENAATRTRQKRSFHQLNLNAIPKAEQVQKIKVTQMGCFLEHAPISAILLSDTDRIVNFNQQARKLFPLLETVDVELSQVFPKEQVSYIKEFIHQQHDPEASIELSHQQKIFELTSSAVYTEEGEKHFLLLLNDVTHVRQETQRIHSILEALPQIAWTAGADGYATYFTQGWYFYTSQSKEQAAGEGWVDVVYAADKEKLLRQWKSSLASGKPFQQAARYRNAKGEYRWHLVRASAIQGIGKEILMWVGTCTDIHDQVLLTEELEKKVKERTHSLEIINNELEQFTHVSSHDLQEPLRKIMTFASMLKTTSRHHLDEQSNKYLDKISTTAERMSESLKDLLTYARLKSEDRFSWVSLNEVVSQVLVDLELMIAKKNATIQVSELPVLNAIPVQMQQLFYNLINNALKFSRPGTPPIVEISATNALQEEITMHPELIRFKEYYKITIKDNGIGFEQKYAEKIFAIFQRLHSKTAYEGTGIGLSLVKKVAINHRGLIYAVSEPDNGAAFHVLLPQL
ncbi:ATP-binding protein [Flavihumibacter sp. ZG627]|uniref:sensor histidine kinase n=1 Tax=Flavihumibacter sp. ZG627 TaxID=1463156 RepID=UPI000694D659|nr:ATP-binding protein [Flavihumibacter sp. ZG627]